MSEPKKPNFKAMMQKLRNLEGGVKERYNPFADVIQTPSPSVNFTYGNTHGLPRGYSQVLYGPPKGGKTTLLKATIGKLHQDDPDAYVAWWDAEMRSDGQLTEAECEKFGIDWDRLILYQANKPDQVFDRFEGDIAAQVQDGLPIKAAVIDSVNAVQGRRGVNLKSIMNMTIGDHAQTMQDGLKRILPVQRKHKIALYMTCQVRAEMDEHERMRGNTQRMAASFGLQHHAEYFTFVAPNVTKEGRKDFYDREFIDSELTDLADKGEKTAHKIRVCMKGNSMGPAGRTAEFTLGYDKGIINQWEEIYWLAVNRGIVERPTNRKYVYEGTEWDGKDAFARAIEADQELAHKLLMDLKDKDIKNLIAQTEEEKANAETIA